MVFLFNEQVVVRLVDNSNVELLRANQVRLGEREVVVALQDLDDSAVVETGSKGSEEVGQQVGLQLSASLLHGMVTAHEGLTWWPM
jgi:hypothetical protein